MDLWIIGAGGLLGSAIARWTPPATRRFVGGPVPWDTPELASQTLRHQATEFARQRRADRPWAVVWAAGTGVPASSPEELAAQARIQQRLTEDVAATLDADGTFLLASSTSVYGSSADECDESTPTAPVGAYASAKLAQEDVATSTFAATDGPRLVVARLSTLYGKGQNLAKRQGLVSTMAYEAVRGGVITLHVPLDTMRDYLYSDDAARMCLDLLRRSGELGPGRTVRVIANERATTIAEVSRAVQAVARRRTPVVQASIAPGVRPDHLTFRSLDRELATFGRTPLIVGVKAVVDDVRAGVLLARTARARPA